MFLDRIPSVCGTLGCAAGAAWLLSLPATSVRLLAGRRVVSWDESMTCCALAAALGLCVGRSGAGFGEAT